MVPWCHGAAGISQAGREFGVAASGAEPEDRRARAGAGHGEGFCLWEL